MKRKHLISTLAAVLVTGILIGAAIAYTMLASSIPMNFNVQSTTPLEWDELGRPGNPIYRGLWYNTTVIHYNLSNIDSNQAYKVVNWIHFVQSGSDIYWDDVKGACRYHKDGSGWTGWQDMTFSNGYDGANYFAEGLFGNGLMVEKFDDTGCWIEFQFRFWIKDDAPTGWWTVTLISGDYYDP